MLKLLLGTLLVSLTIADQLSDQNVVKFEDLDRDGNNEITFDEFELWGKKTNRYTDNQQIRQLFQQHDKNYDASLSIAEFVPLALVLSHRPNSQTQAIFRKIDLNNDGIVTREEAQKSEGGILTEIIEGVFQVADVNRDGKITLSEFSSVVDNSQHSPSTQEEQDYETALRLLALIDQNGDRLLSAQEVHAFANVNSKVSQEEVLSAFKYLDSNHDGWIAIDELANLPNKMAELVRFKEAPLVSN
uniref:Calcium-binding protein n=1 Tax=Syphacia muris TaxID=451379 RepID=A0A158R5Q4_9BILA